MKQSETENGKNKMQNKSLYLGFPGRKDLVDLHAIPLDMIDLRTILNTLNHINRFGGRGTKMITVLQHSAIVSDILLRQNCPFPIVLGGLCHDFSEAFIGDIIKPVKDMYPEFSLLEDIVMDQVSHVLKLGAYDHPDVKLADKQAVCFEGVYCGFDIENWGLLKPSEVETDKLTRWTVEKFAVLTTDTVLEYTINTYNWLIKRL